MQTNFVKKYNKRSSVYVIEETHIMPDTKVYEAELEHDNVIDDSITVYSGPGGTGTELEFSITTPEDAAWKRVIHVETNVPTIYIDYESTGDQVEADDINALQDAVNGVENFATSLAGDVRGGSAAYTWGRLMGKTDSDAITITTQPGNLSVQAGDNAEFSIVASSTAGTTLYRWQYEESGSSIWNDFTDGGKDTLSIPTVTTSWNGARIRCIVSDSTGNSKTSAVVTLSLS